MAKISDDNAREYEPHRWTADASELGVSPMQWPALAFETDLGNGQPFALHTANGERAAYRQQLGCLTLTVFNT